jgi:hypothetical protein
VAGRAQTGPVSDLNYTLLMIGTFVVVCLGLRSVQWMLARATTRRPAPVAGRDEFRDGHASAR